VVAAMSIGSSAWERVKTKPKVLTIQITGSAKKRIVSDLIEWTSELESEDPTDRIAAYKKLHSGTAKTLAYLAAQGVKPEDIRASSATISEHVETEVAMVPSKKGGPDERIERRVFKGYIARQTISVRSTDVPRVERVSREVTQLLEDGVPITSQAPAYYYTKLGELKIEMLAEAGRDARTRAENIVKSSGGATLGRLRSADMGVINVNPANSTRTSWEGNNDTASLEKDIITIVHVVYELR
jgi:hypothetical protein